MTDDEINAAERRPALDEFGEEITWIPAHARYSDGPGRQILQIANCARLRSLPNNPPNQQIVSRKIIIQSLPTTEPNRLVDVEVYYDEGGMSYLSGGFNKRGYYLAVQPVKREGNLKSMLAFSGTKALIEEVKRFSARKLQEAALQATQLPIYRKLLDHVLAKNNIRLADETPGSTATETRVAEQITPATPPPVGSAQAFPVAA
jgi:hypothetical protein